MQFAELLCSCTKYFCVESISLNLFSFDAVLLRLMGVELNATHHLFSRFYSCMAFESEFWFLHSFLVNNFVFSSIVHGRHLDENFQNWIKKLGGVFFLSIFILPNTRYEAHVYWLLGPLFPCTDVEIWRFLKTQHFFSSLFLRFVCICTVCVPHHADVPHLVLTYTQSWQNDSVKKTEMSGKMHCFAVHWLHL